MTLVDALRLLAFLGVVGMASLMITGIQIFIMGPFFRFLARFKERVEN